MADKVLSEEFGIPQSIKLTSIKPSGTVSLLAGASPGIHFPASSAYIRRIRLAATSELLGPIAAAGYHIEDDVVAGPDTKVVSIPISFDKRVLTVQEVSAKK